MIQDDEIRARYVALQTWAEERIVVPSPTDVSRSSRPGWTAVAAVAASVAAAALVPWLVVQHGIGPDLPGNRTVAPGAPLGSTSVAPTSPTPSASIPTSLPPTTVGPATAVGVPTAVTAKPLPRRAGSAAPGAPASNQPTDSTTAPFSGPLGAPTGLSARADKGTVSLTWEPAAGASSATTYLVQPLDAAGRPAAGATDTHRARSMVYPSLTAGTYTFVVHAVSGAVTGPTATSGPVTVITAPPVAPAIGTARASGPGSVTVTWTPLTRTQAGGAPVDQYAVYRQTTNGRPTLAGVTTGGVSQLVLKGQATGTTATFQVVAVTTAGGSPPSTWSNAVLVE